jgi:hypothetical protein
MKTTILFLLFLLVGLVAFSPTYGQVSSYAFAKSPDHPSTWVVGATNVHQDLRWDKPRQMLVADVTYSTRDYADGVNPTHKSEYTVSFPTVRFDETSQTFVAKGTHVGTLRDDRPLNLEQCQSGCSWGT